MIIYLDQRFYVNRSGEFHIQIVSDKNVPVNCEVKGFDANTGKVIIELMVKP